MSELRIKITFLEAGQPRAYADSRYRCRIEFEFDPPTTKEPYTVRWTGANLLSHAAHYAWAAQESGRPIRFDKDLAFRTPHLPMTAWEPEWHEARITELGEIAPGIAEVLIIEPYID